MLIVISKDEERKITFCIYCHTLLRQTLLYTSVTYILVYISEELALRIECIMFFV